MKQIFFVEDDGSLISGLTFALERQGYKVQVARTFSEAQTGWREKPYDLIILDVSLPDGSGYDLCRRIRQSSQVPVLFLTAADEETDVIMGLDIGGDDYITKPFKLAIFLSRVNALLRRSGCFSSDDTEIASHGVTLRLLERKTYKKWFPGGSDRRGVQATVSVHEKPGCSALARTDFRLPLGSRRQLYRQQHPDGLYPQAARKNRGGTCEPPTYYNGSWHGL